MEQAHINETEVEIRDLGVKGAYRYVMATFDLVFNTGAGKPRIVIVIALCRVDTRPKGACEVIRRFEVKNAVSIEEVKPRDGAFGINGIDERDRYREVSKLINETLSRVIEVQLTARGLLPALDGGSEECSGQSKGADRLHHNLR